MTSVFGVAFVARNNTNLNQSAMISIEFHKWGNELFWKEGTTDTGYTLNDMMKYPG